MSCAGITHSCQWFYTNQQSIFKSERKTRWNNLILTILRNRWRHQVGHVWKRFCRVVIRRQSVYLRVGCSVLDDTQTGKQKTDRQRADTPWMKSWLEQISETSSSARRVRTVLSPYSDRAYAVLGPCSRRAQYVTRYITWYGTVLLSQSRYSEAH